jgi:hypothetical protein
MQKGREMIPPFFYLLSGTTRHLSTYLGAILHNFLKGTKQHNMALNTEGCERNERPAPVK